MADQEGGGATVPPELCCTFCKRSFKRKEHLARHLTRHSGSKPFKCSLCTKTFSRRDTLMRHASTHDRPSSSPALSKRRSRSCTACAATKLRCAGAVPCDRCLQKNLVCEFIAGTQRDKAVSGTPPIDKPSINRYADGAASQTSVNVASEGQPFDRLLPPDVAILPEHRDDRTLQQDRPVPDKAESISAQISPGAPGSNTMEDCQGVMPDAQSIPEFDVYPPGLDQRTLDQVDSWTSGSIDTLNLPLLWTTDDLFNPEIDPSHANLTASCITMDGTCSERTAPSYSTQSAPTSSQAFVQTELQPVAGALANNRQALIAPSHAMERPFRVSFPEPQAGDDDIALAEDFHHVCMISSITYQSILLFYEKQRLSELGQFPSQTIFNAFIQLYYECFDRQYPFIHSSILGRHDTSWLLVLAIAAVGCQYSSISNADQYAMGMQELLRQAIEANKQELARSGNLYFAQSVLLANICLMFSGLKSGQMKLQCERNELVTLCRKLLEDRDTVDEESRNSTQTIEKQWRRWIVSESRNRVILCAFVFECFQLILFDLRPLFFLKDLVETLPKERLWRCQNARDWKERYSADLHSPSTIRSHLHSDSKIDTLKALGSFSRTAYVLALYLEEKVFQDEMRRLKSHFGLNPDAAMSPIAAVLSSSVDEMLLTTLPTKDVSGEPDVKDLVLHILVILRNVSLRDLYAHSGWQAGSTEIDKSRETLRMWFRRNPKFARASLWHALVVFSTIRNRHHVEPHDPFLLLIAVLYIWAFDQLADSESGRFGLSEDGLTRHVTPTRVDRLSTWEDVNKWIEEGATSIHVTGVGLLRGAESAKRLMVDFRRILISRKSWFGLCRGLSYAIERLIQGKHPRHLEDKSECDFQ